ncbi:hypothetical protein BYT27DRAFT_7208610 [Phlegmacium glaucopus]|nr:hypothetical protein BYT27DRAFT_7208610 [Phlegmacium glaucopus]
MYFVRDTRFKLDPTIDEQSPDEDDRQAMQVVRAPPRIARKTTIVYSDDEVDNGSYPVLEMHQKKNGSIRPPNPDLLRNCAEKPRAEIRGDKDRVGISAPRIKAQTAARTWHQAKSKTFLAPPRRDMAISKDDFEENRQVNDASDSDNANNTNNVDDADDTHVDDADDTEHSEDNMDIQPRRRQRRTANNDMKPSQLRFYSGTWVDVLIAAKNNYRLFVHTEDPFPERTAASLEDAHRCLLDAVGSFTEENKLPLDEDVYNKYSSGMSALVFEDGSTYRGRLKTLGRSIVKLYYKDALEPDIRINHNSDQQAETIRENVASLLKDSLFLLATELDENGRPSNFAHDTIIEIGKQFYYSGKADCLSVIFPAVFSKGLPKTCLAMVCTCIVNCLEEWETGVFRATPFTGARYEAVYEAMMELIAHVKKDDYHGRKLRRLLKHIASGGCVNSRRLQGNPLAGQFKVRLD